MSSTIILAGKGGGGGGTVNLSQGWTTFWNAVKGSLGGIDTVMTIVGVLIVVGAVLKWVFERRKSGGGGMGNHQPVLWALLAGAALASPDLIIPIFLTILDVIANAFISIWNKANG